MNVKMLKGIDSSHASAARVWSLRQRKQMPPSPERPELYGFVRLYSTLLPQAGRQLELCGRTSRDSHPSEDLSKLRTALSSVLPPSHYEPSGSLKRGIEGTFPGFTENNVPSSITY